MKKITSNSIITLQNYHVLTDWSKGSIALYCIALYCTSEPCAHQGQDWKRGGT